MEDPTAPLTRHDAIAHLRAAHATPSEGPIRLGIEQEWHSYALLDVDRHLHPDEVLAPLDAAGSLPHGSAVTVEPGGQVELVTAPAAPWWDGLVVLREDGAALREVLAVAGIALVGAGIDPFRRPKRTLGTPRYVAMEAYFDQFGPAGRRMMGATASVQVNLDHGDDATMQRTWTLAHHLGPVLGAAFACSPSKDERSERLATWGAMDPTRTRPVLRSGDLAEDWVDYVLDARVMLLHDDGGGCHALMEEITFGRWIDEGLRERGRDGMRRPTGHDLEYHCTTLFPPVRPRGWFELRWLDALPAGLADTAVAAVMALLTDEESGDRALRACAGVADAWQLAAVCGPADPRLAEAGATTLRAAADALDRSPAPEVFAESVGDAAERWPARGRCPADDLEDRLRRGAGVMDLADPPWEVHRWS